MTLLKTSVLLLSMLALVVFIVVTLVSYKDDFYFAPLCQPAPAQDDTSRPTLSSTSDAATTKYKILLYTKYYGETWLEELSNNDEIQCGRYKCDVTRDKSDIGSSHAVVFHARAFDIDSCISEVKAGKTHRLQSQRWILSNEESPVHSPDYHKFNGIFNWTMTYKHDSDIWYPYGIVKPGQHKSGFDPNVNYLSGRNKSVVAFISNCNGHRLEMVKALRKYINIDIYGWGSCHDKTKLKCHMNTCWYLLKDYKFYLAIENSICKEYITEKTYRNAYDYDLVPVILSGANLSDPEVLPQGSYIDAAKFSSAKELAEYLKQVGSDSKLYSRFFEWRAHWTTSDFVMKSTEFVCRICEKLHESNNNSVKTYKNMDNLHNKNLDCKPHPIW